MEKQSELKIKVFRSDKDGKFMSNKFGMEDCKPIETPLDDNFKLVKLTEEEYAEEAQSMSEVPYK